MFIYGILSAFVYSSELLAKIKNVTPPSRRQIVSRRFITYLDAGGDASVTMIRFLQEARVIRLLEMGNI